MWNNQTFQKTNSSDFYQSLSGQELILRIFLWQPKTDWLQIVIVINRYIYIQIYINKKMSKSTNFCNKCWHYPDRGDVCCLPPSHLCNNELTDLASVSSAPHTTPPVLREKLPETITWLSLYKTYLSLRHLSSHWLGSMWMQSLFQSSSTHPYFIATTTETLITYSSKVSMRHKALSLLHQTLHPALHCLCGASLPVVREAGWWCGCECVGDSLPACRDSVLLLPQVPSSHPNPLVCWVLRCPRVFCRSCKINNNT